MILYCTGEPNKVVSVCTVYFCHLLCKVSVAHLKPRKKEKCNNSWSHVGSILFSIWNCKQNRASVDSSSVGNVFVFQLTLHLTDLYGGRVGWWCPSQAHPCSADKPQWAPRHSEDLKGRGGPPPVLPLGPLCTGWWHLDEKQERKSCHGGSVL